MCHILKKYHFYCDHYTEEKQPCAGCPENATPTLTPHPLSYLDCCSPECCVAVHLADYKELQMDLRTISDVILEERLEHMLMKHYACPRE